MSNNSQLFPQLQILEGANISKSELLSMPYFKQAEYFLQSKDIAQHTSNLVHALKKISVKKGTLIYCSGQVADRCYFLQRGCLQVLIRKNNKQKLEMFPNHNLTSTNEKLHYLQDKYGISKDKAMYLLNQFYQQKVLFKYLNFRTLYGEGEIGIAELSKNSLRVCTVVATSDSQLLVVTKQVFDKYLKQFQKKKQAKIIEKVLMSFSEKTFLQLKNKFAQVLLTSVIKIIDTDQILLNEGASARYLYFIVQGELQLQKTAQLQIPKKFQSNEDRKIPPKDVELKIHMLGKDNFIGEQAAITGIKTYNFTVKCISSSTLVLRIEPIAFMKALSENTQVQTDFKQSAQRKIEIGLQRFTSQLQKIKSAFEQQFEIVDNKKKQMLISNFLREDTYNKTKLFEVFNEDAGLFYRDTFQKLQCLNEESPTYIKPKPKTKLRGTGMNIKSPKKDQNAQDSPKLDNDEKMLMTLNSPFRQSDLLMKSSTNWPKSKASSRSSARTLKNIDHFQQLKKDEKVFKRVLIKHGKFQIDRKIDHSKHIKAIVNHNFDEVVTKSISRRNPSIRKAVQFSRENLIRQSYQKMVSTLKSTRSSSIPQLVLADTACKGTLQMKKKMKKLSSNKQVLSSRAVYSNVKQHILEDCIGVNQSPRSRSTNRLHQETSRLFYKPEKIVLLNHMMKPITYRSNQP